MDLSCKDTNIYSCFPVVIEVTNMFNEKFYGKFSNCTLLAYVFLN